MSSLFRLADSKDLFLAILRTPEPGKPLDEKRRQSVHFVSTVEDAMKLRDAKSTDDLILIPLSETFTKLESGLREISKTKDKKTYSR